jgi:hypothetical protein
MTLLRLIGRGLLRVIYPVRATPFVVDVAITDIKLTV